MRCLARPDRLDILAGPTVLSSIETESTDGSMHEHFGVWALNSGACGRTVRVQATGSVGHTESSAYNAKGERTEVTTSCRVGVCNGVGWTPRHTLATCTSPRPCGMMLPLMMWALLSQEHSGIKRPRHFV